MTKFDPYEHLNIVLNEDGTLTLYLDIPKLPATGEEQPLAGQTVVSKDVTLDGTKKTWMRIFRPSKLPSNDKSVAKLPIIIFLHAGGWIDLNVANVFSHEHATKCPMRSQPSCRPRVPTSAGTPAEDAINWVRNQALDPKGDQWLKDFGDYSICYLYGASCGANMAYNAALLLLETKLDPLKIVGLIMNQPFIGGKQRTKSELKLATDQYFPLSVIDLLWELALPVGMDRDHRFCNPLTKTKKENLKSIGRCLVIGFGGDPLIDRQQEFVKMLVMRGGFSGS